MFLIIKYNFINRLILLAILVILLIFSYDLYFTEQQINKLSYSLKHPHQECYIKKTKTMPLSYYEEDMLKRNIFKKDLAESTVNKVIPQGPTFKELVKDLHLLGIASGSKPQVIIEDTKLGRTYFLYLGDYLGEIKIAAINSDSVELEFRGEKINLFL